MTQRELAEKAGMSESALRGYGLDDRNPKPVHLKMIAEALQVRPEVFADTTIRTDMEAIHLIFNFEDCYKIYPVEDHAMISSYNSAINQAFRDRGVVRAKMQSGEITKDEYEDWKDTYTLYIDQLED